jgi:hypothetical protein
MCDTMVGNGFLETGAEVMGKYFTVYGPNNSVCFVSLEILNIVYCKKSYSILYAFLNTSGRAFCEA